MWMRAARLTALLGCVPLLCASVPSPADWVSARWPWSDVPSLELLAGSPVNCLLVKTADAAFLAAAAQRGLVTLRVIAPGGDALAVARQALAARATGIVLEGDFPEGVAASVTQAAGDAPVVELTARSRMALGGAAAVIGTYQGVWPGIAVQESGAAKAGPSGSVWIDTNTGFIRAVRAWGGGTLWLASLPPPGSVVTGARYLQAIADAAISGARWVLAFDDDFAGRLHGRDAGALAEWRRINELLLYFERHPEWRHMREYGRLALVQDPAKGGLLSGGILDMIAVKHTPVRPVPRQRLSAEALQGASMAVDVDADALTAEQREVLRSFTRSGGTLLTAPPGWKDQRPGGGRITLDKSELGRLDEMWREVNSMIGRQNLGVRLFNVSSMLSNALVSSDGKSAIVHLLNYSDYPVEDVTVYYLGDYRHATLLTPDGAEKLLEIYQTDEGRGVDIARVSVCATIKLER